MIHQDAAVIIRCYTESEHDISGVLKKTPTFDLISVQTTISTGSAFVFSESSYLRLFEDGSF